MCLKLYNIFKSKVNIELWLFQLGINKQFAYNFHTFAHKLDLFLQFKKVTNTNSILIILTIISI